MRPILLQNLEQLDAENLQQFANDWEKIFKGDANSNFKILQQFASEFKKMKLTLPQMTLTNFPINNGWETVFYERTDNTIANAFIVSKKQSVLLLAIIKQILVTNKKVAMMNTTKKIINKNKLIFFSSGPALCYYVLMELELYYFYFHKKYAEKLINLFNIRSYQSTWYCRNSHETAIKDETELRKYFFDHTQDSSIPNFEDRLEIININKKLQAGAYTAKSASKAWKNLPFNTPLWFDSDEINNMQSLMENPSPDSQYLKTISRYI